MFLCPTKCHVKGLRLGFLIVSFLMASLSAVRADEHSFLPADHLYPDRQFNAYTLETLTERAKKYHLPDTGDPMDLLRGTRRQAIMVIDAETKRPVTDFVIHGIVRLIDGVGVEETSDSGPNHLESKRVSDQAGQCVYDKLGEMKVEFQVFAEGYLPNSKSTLIERDNEPLTIALQPAGVVKGQLIDAISGEPLPSIDVGLALDKINGISRPIGTHRYGADYPAVTDAQGNFEIRAIPPAKYYLVIPYLIDSFAALREAAQQQAGEDRKNESDSETPTDNYLRKLLAGPLPAVPEWPVVTIKAREVADVGVIRIEQAPTVRLSIVNEKNQPMPQAPFEIVFLDGCDLKNEFGYVTCDDGPTTVALAGWQPGMAVAVFSPPRERNVYRAATQVRIEEQVERLTAALEHFDEKAFYEDEFYISGEETPLLLEDLKNPEHLAEFKKAVKKKKEEIKDKLDSLKTLPADPNHRVVIPQLNQMIDVTLPYRATKGLLHLQFAFRDKATKAAVPHVSGAVMHNPDASGYPLDPYLREASYESMLERDIVPFAGDDSGKAKVPSFVPSALMRNMQDEWEKAKAEGKTQNTDYLERKTHLMVIVDAPGYVPQSFELPLAAAASGKTFVFDLEPEARVRGRIVMAGTTQPPDPRTLHSLLSDDLGVETNDRPTSEPLQPLIVSMINNQVEGRRLMPPYEKLHFADRGTVRIGEDGRFEISGLRPSETWVLEVEPQVARPVALKPGMNDLGDIALHKVGELQGTITDENGNAVAGVRIETPLLGPDRYPPVQSDANGTYRLRLTHAKNAQQFVRLVVPWPKAPPEANRFAEPEELIVLDAVKSLDLTTTNTLSARLDRGHSLEIEIPDSERMKAIARSCTKLDEQEVILRDNPSAMKSPVVYGVVVQGLVPDADGFTYCQTRYFLNTKTPLEEKGATVEVPNVPPGRYAVVLLGGEQQPPPGAMKHPPDPEVYNKEPHPGLMIPMAYAEFEMPSGDGDLRLEPSAADVEVALTDVPPFLPNGDGDVLETMVVLELQAPTWTSIRSSERYLLDQLSYPGSLKGVEALIRPMVTYSLSFGAKFARTEAEFYHPAHLPGVIPGTYRVKAYTNQQDAYLYPETPYFESTLTVPAQTGTVQMSVPNKRRSPLAAPPMPVVESEGRQHSGNRAGLGVHQ